MVRLVTEHTVHDERVQRVRRAISRVREQVPVRCVYLADARSMNRASSNIETPVAMAKPADVCRARTGCGAPAQLLRAVARSYQVLARLHSVIGVTLRPFRRASPTCSSVAGGSSLIFPNLPFGADGSFRPPG
jgi:hypothetical protein